MSFCFEHFKKCIYKTIFFLFFFFFFFFFWGGGDRVKSRKNSITGLIPSNFMILYLNRYRKTETSVFKYTHRLRHDTVFQYVHVVPDQPLHRWLVVRSFHV